VTPPSPSVLVFDVNETLLDITALEPVFAQVFGDPRVLREWFGHFFEQEFSVDAARV
jgi:2-haloacid dehalogenase